MSDEKTFTCNKCGGTSNEETSPDGKVHLPFENIPVANAYWKNVASVTCSICWDEWKDMEIKVLNEYRLNMLEREHRQMLRKYMTDFLNVEGKADGGGQVPDAVAQEWKPEEG